MEQLYNQRDLFFWTGFGLLLLSILFHAFKKNIPAVVFLLVASFLFFFYSAVSIPFLNVWDERFHALVAKNLMKHPLIPTLYDEALLNLPYGWDKSHIWVHKQPLFLWQAMLSYKIFGVNELAFRFPGIVLACGVVFGAYRSGKLLGNHDTGYCAAFLVGTSLYVCQLISGWAPLDQNDLVFMEYISLSIWTMIEYEYTGKKYWIIITGIFSGFAMLTKWLVGLLVYLIWFIYTFLKHKINIKQYIPAIISLLISLIISMPWQIYIFKCYPAESNAEYQTYLNHISTAVDGQGGPFSFHFNFMGLLFGSLVPYAIIPSLLVFYLKSNNRKLSLSIIISILFIYLFFSVAKTKMQSFTTVAMLPMYLSIAFLIQSILDWIFKKVKLSPFDKSAVIAICFLFLAIFRLDFNSLKTNNGFWGNNIDCFNGLKHNKAIFQKLTLPGNTVLCNVPGRHFVEAMFYTGLPAYGFIPNENQYLELKNKGRKIALFMPLDGKIPSYIKNDSDLIILKDTLHQCE
jgi:4-amino-4-deoxy-L-arabinose transferase-like glycosyltransferase